MYICQKCHDRDEKITRCLIPFLNHPVHIRSVCDICGKVDVVTGCWAYNYLKSIGGKECSFVKNAMNEIDE